MTEVSFLNKKSVRARGIYLLQLLLAKAHNSAVRLKKKHVLTKEHAFLMALSRCGLVHFRDDAADVQAGGWEVTPAGMDWLGRGMSTSDPHQASCPDSYQAYCTRFLEEEGEEFRVVSLNPRENPLSWLAQRKDKNGYALLSNDQIQAGERLYQDFYLGKMAPYITRGWLCDEIVHGRHEGKRRDPADLSLKALAARARLDSALAFVGPELAPVLLEVCCHFKTLSALEKERDWPARSGRVVLSLALTRLSTHYGEEAGGVFPEA